MKTIKIAEWLSSVLHGDMLMNFKFLLTVY